MSLLTVSQGMPTAVDVRKLRAAFDSRKEGQLIGYDEINEVLRVAKDTHRWRSVVQAWRRQLYRERNELLIAETGKGFVVASPSERIHFSASKYKSGLRFVRRAGDVSGSTDRDRLNEEEKKICDHLVTTTATLKTVANTQARNLRLNLPTLDKK